VRRSHVVQRGRMHKGRELGIVIFLVHLRAMEGFIYWEMECDGY